MNINKKILEITPAGSIYFEHKKTLYILFNTSDNFLVYTLKNYNNFNDYIIALSKKQFKNNLIALKYFINNFDNILRGVNNE